MVLALGVQPLMFSAPAASFIDCSDSANSRLSVMSIGVLALREVNRL
jgi:hypothetical protein